MHHRALRLALGTFAAAFPACAEGAGRSEGDTVLMYVAASLMQPLRPVADSFSSRTGAVLLFESGGSLEHARKLTDLGRMPDLLLLADGEVFPQLLVPAHVSWYAEVARNRMVIAYTPRSRFAAEVGAANWRDVLQRAGVEVGRPDPDRAPAGYRTLLLLQLAESHYGDRGLMARILARSPPRNMRANAAELAGLLAAGEMDYIFEYESLARAQGFRFVTLPREIDLSDPALSKRYAQASVRVAGRTPRDSMTVRGAPILYGLSIPDRAPRPAAAARFVDFLLGDGKPLLRAGSVDVLETPRLVTAAGVSGVRIPASLAAAPSSGREPR